MIVANLRKTSANPGFPWDSKRSPLIKIDLEKETIEQAKSKWEKVDMLRSAVGNDKVIILAAWPGEWSQDIFLVDDIDQALLELV